MCHALTNYSQLLPVTLTFFKKQALINQNIQFEVKLRAGFLKLGTVSLAYGNCHACHEHFTATKFSTILSDGSSKGMFPRGSLMMQTESVSETVVYLRYLTWVSDRI